MEAIRPLVLPKLREEKERSKKKSSKKKAIKDTVGHDEFEASMFLTETTTRHSLLYKKKHFHERLPKIQSNSNKLLDGTDAAPVDVDDVQVFREDSDDEGVNLDEIPLFVPEASERKRAHEHSQGRGDEAIEIDSDDEGPLRKRTRGLGEEPGEEDDKKKLAMDISYEGFAIYGRVLCLVIRKRENANQAGRSRAFTGGRTQLDGQAKMENWITSTQLPAVEPVT